MEDGKKNQIVLCSFYNVLIISLDGTNTECDDVAIIGAGIAGSFAAWRLRHSNLSISVYEYSNRIGGRIFTSHINGVKGFNAELGAMRFHIPCKWIRLRI